MKDMTITNLFSTTCNFRTFNSALTKYLEHTPGSLQKSNVAQYSHNSTPKVIKILSQIVKAIIRCSPSLDFSFGVRISMIGHFYRQKWKNFTFSSLNSKHPIKVNFSIFDLEHVFSEKKSTYKKRQNGSSPFYWKSKFSPILGIFFCRGWVSWNFFKSTLVSLFEVQNVCMIIKNDVLDRLGHGWDIFNTIALPKLIF